MKNTYIKHARIIKYAEANSRIEGFIVSKDTKGDCLDMLKGKTTAKKLIKRYISQAER